MKATSKIFKRITNNHSLTQSHKKTQAENIQEEEITMNINVPYIEGTSEHLGLILRSHKIRYTFCPESTLRKLLCKPKDRVASEDIFHEINCSNCEPDYLDESKRSFKQSSDEHKQSVRLWL